MKIYNQLLQEIKTELSKENIESNENQISLYDLYSLVSDEYQELNNITLNKKILKNKDLIRRPSPKKINFYYGENKSSIHVWFKGYSSIIIEKEHGSKNFFVTKYDHPNKKEVNKFLKKYYDEIMSVLFILEKYGSELYKFETEITKLNIEHNNYIFNIEKGYYNDIYLNIKLKDDIEHKEIYKRQYYEKDTLMKILEDSKYELAKKIKIDVNTLDNSIVEVINKSRENNNKKLVK